MTAKGDGTMNTRERFKAIMNFKPFDRLPILEWAGWWDKTVNRWYNEGLPRELKDRYDICRHLGMDIYVQDWFNPRSPHCPAPASHGAPIISSLAEYEKIAAILYDINQLDERQWADWAERQARGDVAVWFTLEGPFWYPRKLLGIEQHLFAFYDQPELMKRINRDLLEWNLKLVERVCSFCTPDFMTFAEDMSYNLGSMLSKDLFDEFMAPFYNTIIPVLKKKGIVPVIDSDGDITVPAHWFESVGIDGILPLERQSGVDVELLRREHPRMKFIGHYDKMVMNKGEAAMRGEFERLLPTAAAGGFLISCDHQTPPGVSYNDYLLYLKLFREYGEEAGRRSVALSAKKS